jgi:hypothetical protein
MVNHTPDGPPIDSRLFHLKPSDFSQNLISDSCPEWKPSRQAILMFLEVLLVATLNISPKARKTIKSNLCCDSSRPYDACFVNIKM